MCVGVLVCMFIYVYEGRALIVKLCFRYHYNVADVRLDSHIEKGIHDGMYISSVASSQSLWSLVMDTGTGFSDQVYQQSANFFNKVCAFSSLYLSFMTCIYY